MRIVIVVKESFKMENNEDDGDNDEWRESEVQL